MLHSENNQECVNTFLSFKCVACRSTPTTNIFHAIAKSFIFYSGTKHHKYVEIYQSNPPLTYKC